MEHQGTTREDYDMTRLEVALSGGSRGKIMALIKIPGRVLEKGVMSIGQKL